MELKEIIKNIPKELYEHIAELAKQAYLQGKSEFTEEILPSGMQKLTEDEWDMLHEKNIIYRFTDKTMSFSSLDLQIYLALEKMVKIDNYTVYDIERKLAQDWYENEEFTDIQYDILHIIAMFNQKKFNKEYLLTNLNNFINKIQDDDEDSIAENILKQLYIELSSWYDLRTMGTLGYSSFINDCLRYLGIDVNEILNSVHFEKYEIIIRNNYFKELKIENTRYNEYTIKLEKMKKDEYFMEILRENGIIDKLNDIYINIINITERIEKELEADYFECLKN